MRFGTNPQINLTATITNSGSQATLGAVPTTLTVGSESAGPFIYVGALTPPAGSSASLDATNTANPSFTPDVPGTYTVTLTATDSVNGATVTKVRTQEVANPLSIALSSTASSQDTLSAVTETVTTTGGLGDIVHSASLTKPTGSAASVSGGTTTSPGFTPDEAGGYRLTVTATDAAGQTATASRFVEVGTAPLAVSIAAISNQTTPTGTITCDSTVTGAVGSVVYAWTGTKSDGTAVSFSDATAADPTVTLSINDRPGVYTVAVTVTDAAGRTATATRTFRVGTSTGWVTSYDHDFTADANSTISASPWVDAAGGSWGVENIANASTFAVQNGTGLVIVSSAGDLLASTRTCPILTRALTNLAPSYAANRRLLAMMQIGTGTTIAASQHSHGLHFEGATSPIGVAGTSDRGGGVLWRNNGGTLQVAGLSRGNTTTGLQVAAKPATETAPRVLAFERAGWSVRVGYSTNTAAYGDPDHASWVWSESFGIDFISTASKLDPATDLLAIHCRKGAGTGSPTLVLEKLAMLVRW